MNLREMEEYEAYQLNRENLINLQKHMDDRLSEKINKLHIDFLEFYGDELSFYNKKISFEEVCLIKKIFQFLKKNM